MAWLIGPLPAALGDGVQPLNVGGMVQYGSGSLLPADLWINR